MPGIDFAQVRALVSLLDVLNLIGFVPSDGFSVQVRGPCPIGAIAALPRFSAEIRVVFRPQQRSVPLLT